MIELLVPLGLLGLIGIVVLIIIYIIKPNYLTKHVSSTYIWKRSLKYRKKRIPTSKIRNLLIFLCQLFAITLIAGILTMPALVHRNQTDKTEVIAVIDSSASMYTQSDGETRFQRAVSDVTALAHDVFLQDGYVSVIVADNEPYYLAREVSYQNSAGLFESLNALLDNPSACYYGTSDIEKAMSLCEEVLNDNPSAKIQLFTDTDYLYVAEGITVINVSESDEWNVGILTATAEIENAFQTLTVEIGSYGRALELTVNVEITGANAADASEAGTTIRLSQQVSCNSDVVSKVIFKYFSSGNPEGEENTVYYLLGLNERFRSYHSIHISLEVGGGSVGDSFPVDDSFEICGGQKEVLRVQYASSRNVPSGPYDKDNPGLNRFVNGALGAVKNAMGDRWDIAVTEVSPGKEPALEGFDLYIFEHDMPDELPTDGVVFLLDPTLGWAGAGIEVIGVEDLNKVSVYLSENIVHSNHVVLNNPNGYQAIADNITVSCYKVVTCNPEEYDVLMTCDTNPVLMVKKDGTAQVAVMSFSVHNSNIPRILELFYLFYNMFDYYFPGSVNKNAFEVGESITLNSRGPEVTVSGREEPFKELPAEITMDIPGLYTVKQTTYYGKASSTEVFVKVPAWESNVQRTEDTLAAPFRGQEEESVYDDMLIYLAAALVVLLFVEWLLHTSEGK